ncbi:uncharacterized protein JCM6883_004252 [Sporobolomyces salmoneus]|uniref:uncharacterized protein n=1 Tax=Sporobolomyces salmoneus TaxID=183962 RepID=UPI00317CEEA6
MPNWEDTVKTTRAQLQAKIDQCGPKVQIDESLRNVSTVRLEGLLDRDEIDVTEQDVDALLSKMASAEWSAEKVIRAFLHRAVIAHQLTNCLTDLWAEDAIARAKYLDEELKKTGKPVGVLHGLPISLKCQIDVEGKQVNMGYVGWVDRIAKKNAVLVDLLLKQGAVLYCYTNVPQALMSGETLNNLYGRTVMPFNRGLSSGGSSGGEGALIALRGSPLGVGSDIGGSIRIPSAFNGLYGLRPSYHRIPYGGATNSLEGFEAINSVLGPMTTSLSALKLFVKAVLEGQPWRYDPNASHIAWRESQYELEEHNGGKELVFGIMWSDGLVKPTPPIIRGLKIMKEKLEAQGHKVIDYTPPNAEEGNKITGELFEADGGRDIAEAVALSSEPNLNGVLSGDSKELSAFEYWRLCLRRKQYITKQLAAWEATQEQTGTGRPIDAMIAPVAPYTSFTHDSQQYIGYTGTFNVTDQSVGIVPVTSVTKEDVKAEPHEFKCDFDKINYERYDPEVFIDAPVSLQIVGRKGEEEAVLRMTEICDAALKA